MTVSTDGRFEVGRRLKEDFEDGLHYYEMHGRPISVPADPRLRPSREALDWHPSCHMPWAAVNPPAPLARS